MTSAMWSRGSCTTVTDVGITFSLNLLMLYVDVYVVVYQSRLVCHFVDIKKRKKNEGDMITQHNFDDDKHIGRAVRDYFVYVTYNK